MQAFILPLTLLIRFKDSALMRPGRLDRMLYVGPPDHDARKEILSIRLREMKVDPDIDLHLLAQKVCRTKTYG